MSIVVSFLLALLSLTSLGATDWPQWHGPARDRHSKDPRLAELRPWSSDLEPQWRQRIGPGHSSPVVSNGLLLYLDDNGSAAVAHCLDAQAGRELWQTSFGEHFADEWGVGPRCTPFIDGDRAYIQSSRGEFRCLDLKDGRVIWGLSFPGDFGAKIEGSGPGEGAASRRGYNGSGVVEGDSVILAVGAPGAMLVCCDKASGAVRWRSGDDEVAYASLVTASFGGVRQVIAFTAVALTGVRVSDGKVLWRVPFRTVANRHAATPVLMGNLVVVNSHTFGLAAVRIEPQEDRFTAEIAWLNPELKINVATPVAVNGYLYSVGAEKDFVCVDGTTGELCWSQPNFVGSGRRDYTAAIALGSRLLVLADDGVLRLLEATADRYTELARSQVCGNTWTFPALADGCLYVRDNRQLARFALF